jgi:hypothetical protein
MSLAREKTSQFSSFPGAVVSDVGLQMGFLGDLDEVGEEELGIGADWQWLGGAGIDPGGMGVFRYLFMQEPQKVSECIGLKATIEPGATHGLALSRLPPCIRYEKAY